MIAVSIDGVLVAPDQASVSIFDRGFLFGDGVFEVFRTWDGVAIDLEAHLDRLFTSAVMLGIKVLEKALVAKGLKPATGTADLNVFFNLGAQRGTDTEVYPAGWRGRARRVVKVPNAQGTMVIDMRDPSTRSLVWRAVVNEDEPNPAKLADKLDDMVKKAIKEYPPKK